MYEAVAAHFKALIASAFSWRYRKKLETFSDRPA
jgi:hypothetical protein